MKRRVLALALAGLLALSGCSAMLNQTYTRVEPAQERLSAGDDPSVLEVEDKSALTTAVLTLVRQGVDQGVIRLKNYRGDVELDLSDACLEVVQEDPLGSYAAEAITYDWSHIISYYEANIYITYRRSHEQVAALAKVTGSSAIRAQLRDALAGFAPEALLQISYFAEDEEYIRGLLRQAYYESPATALGMPAAVVTLYPDETAGYRRVVEVLFTYAVGPELLRERAEELSDAAAALMEELSDLPGDQAFLALFDALRERAAFAAQTDDGQPCNTPWHALVRGEADSEGFALAAALLCRQLERDCTVVSGALDGQTRYWTVVRLEDGSYRHLDAAAPGGCLLTDAQLLDLGYTWVQDDESIPVCEALPPEQSPS